MACFALRRRSFCFSNFGINCIKPKLQGDSKIDTESAQWTRHDMCLSSSKRTFHNSKQLFPWASASVAVPLLSLVSPQVMHHSVLGLTSKWMSSRLVGHASAPASAPASDAVKLTEFNESRAECWLKARALLTADCFVWSDDSYTFLQL